MPQGSVLVPLLLFLLMLALGQEFQSHDSKTKNYSRKLKSKIYKQLENPCDMCIIFFFSATVGKMELFICFVKSVNLFLFTAFGTHAYLQILAFHVKFDLLMIQLFKRNPVNFPFVGFS